ncbi:MAG TPA: hypothetical protein VNZ55_04900, partial [Thermomicrobiales bacterium]|nr:hypothetical protein [Thermomicrobiales bacterium]
MLDVNLPDRDCFSVCLKLREDRNDVPVILLIACEDPADQPAVVMARRIQADQQPRACDRDAYWPRRRGKQFRSKA